MWWLDMMVLEEAAGCGEAAGRRERERARATTLLPSLGRTPCSLHLAPVHPAP